MATGDAMIKCGVCGHSYYASVGHNCPTTPETREEIGKKYAADKNIELAALREQVRQAHKELASTEQARQELRDDPAIRAIFDRTTIPASHL